MGHMQGPDGVGAYPHKVNTSINMSNPTDVSSTRRVLGIVNSVTTFVPNHDSMSDSAKGHSGSSAHNWGSEYKETYASRALTLGEQNNTQIKMELLSVQFAT